MTVRQYLLGLQYYCPTTGRERQHVHSDNGFSWYLIDGWDLIEDVGPTPTKPLYRIRKHDIYPRRIGDTDMFLVHCKSGTKKERLLQDLGFERIPESILDRKLSVPR